MSVNVHNQVTHQEADGLAVAPYGKRLAYKFSDVPAGLTLSMPVPEGVTQIGILNVVKTAFVGGTSLTIGDGTDPDLFGTVTLATQGNVVCAFGGAAAKHYLAAGRVVLTFGAQPTAGEGELIVYFA